MRPKEVDTNFRVSKQMLSSRRGEKRSQKFEWGSAESLGKPRSSETGSNTGQPVYVSRAKDASCVTARAFVALFFKASTTLMLRRVRQVGRKRVLVGAHAAISRAAVIVLFPTEKVTLNIAGRPIVDNSIYRVITRVYREGRVERVYTRLLISVSRHLHR